jgi:hypothetical protein
MRCRYNECAYRYNVRERSISGNAAAVKDLGVDNTLAGEAFFGDVEEKPLQLPLALPGSHCWARSTNRNSGRATLSHISASYIPTYTYLYGVSSKHNITLTLPPLRSFTLYGVLRTCKQNVIGNTSFEHGLGKIIGCSQYFRIKSPFLV